MIVTTHEQWVELYNAIRNESRRSEEKHIFIYASSSDCDSVCALRILEKLFQNELIPHGWMSVSRYSEIEKDFSASYKEGEEAMRTAILINCGAAEDVRSLLGLYDRPNVRVVIVDSHRPICHINNFDEASDSVAVLLDESEGVHKGDIPPAEIGADGPDSEGEDDGGEDDGGESDGEEGDSPAKRRRMNAGSGSPSSSGADGASRHSRPRRQRGREREQREALREKYYSQGVSYGKPAACMMFDLAYHLQQETAYMLWLALVGLTDHLVHNRLAPEKYAEYYLHYESHALAAGHLDVPAERPAADGDGTTFSNNAVQCRILPQDDYRFGLLWEWNLYEAMQFSPYVAARLQTYTDKGRQMLEMLIAKCGIPLAQAQSSYLQDMQPRFRAALQARLEAHAPAFKMTDITLKSFQLQDGLKRCVNAVDVVHAATALLECGAGRGGAAAGDQADKFWRCYAALSWGEDGGELRRGLELAKRVQRALISDAGGVVAQRVYHNFKAFRIYDLSDHKIANQAMLSHPMALQRMASFFQEQHFHQRGVRKPVVLVGPRGPEGRCLVVGYEATNRMRGNKLGHAFAAATEAVGAQAWHDLFDTTVIEIVQADVERFKSELLRLASDLL